MAMEVKENLLDEETKVAINDQNSYTPLPVLNNLTEPQILFMGTSSMKPSQYRGASAIFVFNK